MSVNISFRCPDELYSALLEYKTDDDKNISAALLRLMQSVLIINTEIVEKKTFESSSSYMTEERFDYRVEPFTKLIPTLVSRIEQLEEAIDYYDKALTSLIEEPALLNLFKDPETQEQLILFIERLKDSNATRTISVVI